MEVRINGKLHKRIETLSPGKLEHLLQLAEIEITNYKASTVNYPSKRQALRTRYLTHLETQRDIIRAAQSITPE